MTFDRYKQEGGIVLESYSSESEAERAVRALQDAGFGADDISIVAKDEGRAQGVAQDTGTDTAEGAGIGAATGGVLGALGGLIVGATALTIPGIGLVIAGPLAAVLGGAGLGAVTGGLAGALAGLGVSKDEAEQYQERVEAGDILVVVAAGQREAEARQILEGRGYESGQRGQTEYVREDRVDQRGQSVREDRTDERVVEDEDVDYRTVEGQDITVTPRE